MSFEWFVARRYLTARRRQAFISLISGVSILGVGVGVMALIIALALMTGVQSELRDRIVGSTAHVYVYKHRRYDVQRPRRGDSAAHASPASSAPRRRSWAGHDVSPHGRRAAPVDLKGIDPAREPQVTDIRRGRCRAASLDALVNGRRTRKDGIILGADLAKTLRRHGRRHGRRCSRPRASSGRRTATPEAALARGRRHVEVRLLRDRHAFHAFVSLQTAEPDARARRRRT